MRYLLPILILMASCQKDEPVPPAPPTPPTPVVVCCPETAPDLIAPTEGATLSIPITWTWTAVQGAAKYYIRVEATQGTAWANMLNIVVTDTFTIQTDPNAVPPSWDTANGRWRVQGIASDGTTVGPWSAWRTFTLTQ